jgi:eukaryotic-like serine/threonine-protein kinase
MTHSYCINKNCDDRQNSINAQYCQSCGTPLLINNRYRLIRTLRDLDYEYNSEIFVARDYQDKHINQPKDGEYKQKILKVLTRKNPYFIELFQQEQDLLTKFEHPGIPRGVDAFEVFIPKSNSYLRCLVMEKIEGVDLEQWIQSNPPESGRLAESNAVDWLKQITEILDYVHQKNFFHRDIKPSNIMLRETGQLVLIDFGTARNVTQTVVNGHPVTVIQSLGYTAPEQLTGQAAPQSDFYALGRTFVYLLTGKHPDTITPHESWRQQTQPFISELFKDVIDQLMEQDPLKRTQNLQTQLNRLLSSPKGDPTTIIRPRPSFLTPLRNQFLAKKSLLIGGAGLFSLLGILAFSQIIPSIIFPTGAEICDEKTDDLLSCGEQIFVSKDALDPEKETPKEKEDGVKAIQEKRYPEAEKLLQQAWETSQGMKRPDPETLIYLNNVKIARRNPNEPVYTLAIVAPLSTPDGTPDTGLDLLRAVAMAQTQAIQSGLNLQIIVANDENRPETAKDVAEALIQKTKLLGVVGHYASETTLAALPIYKKHNLPLVSGTSTSTKLSSEAADNNFFRTVSTTQEAAQALVSFLLNKAQQKQVATLYDFNETQEFSRDIGKRFSSTFKNSGGIVVKEFDLSKRTFNPLFILQQAQKEGATTLALFPSGHTDPSSFRNMRNLFESNRGRLWIVGGNTLYSRSILESLEMMAVAGSFPLTRFVVVVDWHSLERDGPNPTFVDEARTLWKGDVGWRTATTYDAIQVLITGLEKLKTNTEPTRQKLKEVLADKNFRATGATGDIQFAGSNRRNPNASLLKVIKKCGENGYSFVPLTYEASCSSTPPDLELQR